MRCTHLRARPLRQPRARYGLPRRRGRGRDVLRYRRRVPDVIDVTDATFEHDVLDRSDAGPRRRRPVGAVVRPVPHPGPILEKAVEGRGRSRSSS